MEWVEIIEPRTKEFMYANLTTGECAWDPPEGVHIKRTDSSQCWELFDANTKRFYYYNVASQTSVWHRPANCDIIPLAKLQTLKQNIDPSERKDCCTQTSHSKVRTKSNQEDHRHRYHFPGVSDINLSSERLSLPHERYGYRLPSSDMLAAESSHKHYKQPEASTISRSKHKDSGKSSDSSLSSTHGYRRVQEGGSLRICSSHKNRHSSDSKYQQHCSHPKLSYSFSNSSDLAALSPIHSANMPILKKKLSSENPAHGKRESGTSHMLKHQSVDCSGSGNMASLTRSGSFVSSQSHSSQRYNRKATDKNCGGGSDDSMHEKYFKSVENTPMSRRKHNSSVKSLNNQKNSSDSSPQSPVSPKDQNKKSIRPSILNNISNISSPSTCYNNMVSSQSSDLDLPSQNFPIKSGKYLDEKKSDKQLNYDATQASKSPSGNVSGYHDLQKKSNLFMKSTSPGKGGVNRKYSPIASSHSNKHNVASSFRSANTNQEHFQNKSNYDRFSDPRNVEVLNSKREKKHQTTSTDTEYDNGNTSPLYSNWDQEMQEHLLPLQHYIIEQAKLSGCYGFGDPLDSDSFHSDSQSEHSFSGHEPDNEDSDHSDGHGDYLTHNFSLMNDYASQMGDGVSYYNYEYNLGFNDKEDISDNVEAVLESQRDESQIYSPVKNYPQFNFPSQTKVVPVYQTKISLPNNQIRVPDQRESSMQQQQQKDVTASESASRQIQKSLPSSPIFTLPSSSAERGIGGLIMKECDIEKFAQDNLNLHSKGIFRKKYSVRDMLSWTSNAISRPMLALARDKAGKKAATELFKLVQIYMGDRKARAGMSLNSVAMDIILASLGQQQLRDELYVQLCRQTTENPKRESLIRGWELMAICLSFIPPSPTFQPAFLNYMNKHRDPTFATSFPEVGKWPIHVQISHYATVCCRRLDRIGNSGRKQAKKPSEDEIEQARNQIFRDSMFGNTLAEVMELQKDKFPDRKLPWIQVTLSEQILLLNGKQTEGIFRVSADVDEVNSLKARLDQWEVPDYKTATDAHAPASLLKLWYRELYDPLIPDELYNECVQTDDPIEANKILKKLPELNKLVLMYLVHFLQQFVKPDVISCTKMDSSNLAMVFAPNCLRCTSQDPKVILENARKEMAFMRTLIQHMDTSKVENLI